MTKKINRKQFLKTFGLSMAGGLIGSQVQATDNIVHFNTLTNDQQDFINLYSDWAEEMNHILYEQKTEPEDPKLADRIMTLSEQGEELNAVLKTHLEDEKFRHYFQAIIDEVKGMEL